MGTFQISAYAPENDKAIFLKKLPTSANLVSCLYSAPTQTPALEMGPGSLDENDLHITVAPYGLHHLNIMIQDNAFALSWRYQVGWGRNGVCCPLLPAFVNLSPVFLPRFLYLVWDLRIN